MPKSDNNNLPREMSKDNAVEYSWTKNKLIAHALGGYNGQAYTNSKEALHENYKNGHKIFEADLILTSDQVLIARHDWNDVGGEPLTLQEFRETPCKRCSDCTPITYLEIASFMEDHPDMYLVTDTKYFQTAVVENTFNYIKNHTSINVLKRVIPQFYKEDMLKTIQNIHPFKSYIYTLYQERNPIPRVLEFAHENNIEVITSPIKKFNASRDLFTSQTIPIFLHTLNKLDDMRHYQSVGAYGFYTDYITTLDEEEILCKPKDLSGVTTFSGFDNNNNQFDFSHHNNGDIIAVYINSTEKGNIYCRIFNSHSSPLTPEFEITSSKTMSPQVLALNETFFVVVWKEEEQENQFILKGQIFESNSTTKIGDRFTMTEMIDGTKQYDVTLAALDGNKFIIAWEEQSGDGGDPRKVNIYAMIRDRFGNIVKPKFEISLQENFNKTRPIITKLNNDNSFVIIWKNKYFLNDEGDNVPIEYDQIKGQIFDSDGNQIGDTFPIESNDSPIITGSIAVSSFGSNSSSQFIVTWAVHTTIDHISYPTTSTRVYSQLFDGSGNKVGEMTELLSEIKMVNDEQVQLSIETLPNEDYILTFSKRKYSNDSLIYYQVYDNSGTALTGITRASTSLSRVEQDPKIECLFGEQEQKQDQDGYHCFIMYQSNNLMEYNKRSVEGIKFLYNLKHFPTQNGNLENQKITIGINFNYTFDKNIFKDTENDILKYESKLENGSPLPDWIHFNKYNRTFYGIKTNQSCPEIFNIQLTAINRCYQKTTTFFNISILDIPNNDPYINTILTDKYLNGGERFEFHFADDAFVDPENYNLSYSAEYHDPNNSSIPSWISFNNLTRSFTGKVPISKINSSIEITIQAQDICNNKVSQSINVFLIQKKEQEKEQEKNTNDSSNTLTLALSISIVGFVLMVTFILIIRRKRRSSVQNEKEKEKENYFEMKEKYDKYSEDSCENENENENENETDFEMKEKYDKSTEDSHDFENI
ncbi:dystroglycan-related [Anaeramoeba flamelloides]|uniref:Dystroglycan-related n=1 Tax=Anaeramoeba flamelloides TaxID=1746091 RepID=A0ABQ8Z3B6_9EUKA|nr:dystroglycan-related [Anaeramoeba flamelloides]